MIILGVESSAVSAGAALVKDNKLLSESYLNVGLTHSETLMPLIDSVITSAKADISDIDVFAVSTGPGSFTGLRIGVGTVKGLAAGTGKETCGVSSLEAMCMGLCNSKKIICPIMDARRSEVYNALYRWENGSLKELRAMRALPLAELLSELPEGALFAGDGAAAYRDEIIKTLGERAEFAPPQLMYQRAAGVAFAAIGKETVPPEKLLPVYIRKPQAERVREEGGLK